MILNNKVSQRLEIIGFKVSVKKLTSRIQGTTFKTIFCCERAAFYACKKNESS